MSYYESQAKTFFTMMGDFPRIWVAWICRVVAVAEAAVAAPTVGQLLPRGIQGPIYFYLQDQGTFRRSLRIPSSSPTQLRLADVDLDGELDQR